MLVRTARDSSLPGRFRRDPEKVFEGLEMTEQVREELLTNIRRRLTPQPVKIRAGTWRDRVTAVATHASRRALTLLSTFALGGPRPPDIELTCFTYEGIDGLVAAIRAGEAASTEDIQIKVGGPLPVAVARAQRPWRRPPHTGASRLARATVDGCLRSSWLRRHCTSCPHNRWRSRPASTSWRPRSPR